jgi:hypothetical protein
LGLLDDAPSFATIKFHLESQESISDLYRDETKFKTEMQKAASAAASGVIGSAVDP